MRILAALLVAALAAFADDTTGAVRGHVSDQTRAAVANAEVELVSESTGQTIRQKSDGEGQYLFNAVRPGTYSLRASVEGFQTHTLSGVRVEVNKTTQVDISLVVGSVSQNVEVTATAAIIDTASARVGSNADEKYITSLPTSTRSSLAFAELAPGVTLVRPGSQVQGNEGATANVNGLRRNSNAFYLDGSDNTGSFRNTALQFPNPEAVQEVQVSTASTSAEFGKQPGGIFNVITKSGTNEVHGSGFLFVRNEALDANSWTRNRAGTPRALNRLQQFGGTLGGPVRRNKTFFFTSYQRYRDFSNGFQNTRQVPTEAMLGGDFSAFGRQLMDPDTGAPLAGNIIPARLLDPVATRMGRELFPTAAALGQRLIWNYRDRVANNEILVKGDHTITDRHALAVSWLRTFGEVTNNAASGNSLPSWAPMVTSSAQDTISARYTWVPTPTQVVQIRFATAVHTADNQNANQGRTLEDFGARWPIGQEGAVRYLPNLTISDGFTANTGVVNAFEQGNFRTGATLAWIRGAHNLKFGGETQRETVVQNYQADRSAFTFDGRASSRSGGVGVFGYSMADFLMGRAASFTQNGIRNYKVYNWANFLFFQDEWRITRRITITPGVRYEFYMPPREADARASAYLAGHRSSQYPNAPAGVAFQGDAGVPTGFFQQDRNNIAPRLGLAWDPAGNGRTAIRGGFGVYYSYQNINIPMWNSERVPWDPSATGGNTRSLVDPWGSSTTIPYNSPPTPFSTSPNDFVYPSRINNLITYDLPFVTPYTLQWNISVQRQVTKTLTVETNYVGNRGFHFDQILEGNLPIFTPTATLNNIEQRRPIPAFSSIEVVSNRARSWYDAFQLAADLRIGNSFRSRVTYVFQKSLGYSEEARGQGFGKPANPLNLNGEKAIIAPTQIFRAFWIYDVPVLRNSPNRALRLLAGWQLSGNFYAQSGTPLDIIVGNDWNFDGLPGDRPNVSGPIAYTSGSADTRMARFFDTSVFSTPSRDRFGGLGRNAVFGPGAINMDAGLMKNFHWAERRYVQLRMEAYNVLNHANLDNPNTNFSSVDFGRILNRSGNRTMQAALRVVF